MQLKDINKEIDDFNNRNISIVPGLTFNQHEMIEKIFFYYNSKFMSGEVDDDGDRKYFFNIVKNPCKVFSKAIDFDTKNIRLLTTGGGDPIKTWFMERDLKFWMRDEQFGKVLNRIFRELPIFGSVVLKVIDGKPFFVDLRNFVVEQSADDLQSSTYKIEIHNYTVPQFKKIAKEMDWTKSAVKETIKKFYEMKDSSHIRVFERYGDVAEEGSDGNTYTYRRTYMADVGVDEFDERGELTVQRPGVLLDSVEWDPEDSPYREFHSEKVPGRWLGIGVVETLIEPQIRQNEISNLQSKASYFAALRVFQSRDSAVNRNLLTDVRNGEILNVDSEITQIDMSDRNLAFFNQESEKWMQNRSELTFSYDVVQGERLPAGTPLGSAQLAVSQTLSYFEGIQENVAMDIKEMIYKDVLPRFEKETNTEHTIRLVGKDLDTYISFVKNDLVMKEMIRLMTLGSFPDEQDRKVAELAVTEAIKQDREKILDVPKNYYKGIKYDIDIDITGESIDTRIRSATRFALLQAITTDPEMTRDPVKRKFLFDMAEDGGLNPHDLFESEETNIEDLENTVPSVSTPGGAGGGVSAPTQIQGGEQQQQGQQTI